VIAVETGEGLGGAAAPQRGQLLQIHGISSPGETVRKR
jgi:hypothetical protein